MSLPVGEQRALRRIEGGLEGSDPRLMSLFVTFGRLVQGEAMPVAENIRPRPVADRVAALTAFFRRVRRHPASHLRLLVVLPTAVAAVICAVTITVVFQAAPRGGPARARVANELVTRPRGCPFTIPRAPVYGC